MPEPLRLAVCGVGNNISALFQGAQYYRELTAQGVAAADFPGIKHPEIGGLSVADIDFVAAFDVHPDKVGLPFHIAVLAAPNNYPRLDVTLPETDFAVEPGLTEADCAVSGPAFERIVRRLRDTRADVLLYSLPTGLQWAADAYAQVALEAGAAFVNCTPELVARVPATLAEFERRGVPLIGDDLASHLGTSVVHRALLGLLTDRGLSLVSSYQLNLGGNEDFKNLRVAGESKRASKLNALAQEGLDTSRVEVIPSAGFVQHLNDNKVGMLNIEAVGWAGTPISVDLKLKVQDSSNAAGVIIDLIRMGAVAKRLGLGGFPAAAARVLKSPAGGHPFYTEALVAQSLVTLDAGLHVAVNEQPSIEHAR
ncbi:MAG TPA: inositol-3-phosphate synthase [Jatrophihabitans sp.]|jgi:myo-inositol-1-phosphate synthase|uniref:inositol-3-phosphate synthase n=1 Tax=Jatrophihabitans sp. TaxID=1932789 RepID=UPI002EF94F1F